MKDDTEAFLKESNAIEGVYDEDSLQQAKYAWEYLSTQKKMDITAVLKTHKILMLHQKLAPNEKGYFRTVPVWIGGREGIQYQRIQLNMKLWCMDMNYYTSENMSKILHIQYEIIHPFIDGNGRTGRMFMNWWRIKNGLPLLIIHEGPEQIDYYQWFK